MVRLPLVTSAGTDGGAADVRAEAVRPPSPLSGRSILVVDDNADAAESLALLSQLAGNEVHTAFDGPGALVAASKHRPDLVILDIGLPGMNGHEVARRLRRDVGLNHVKLIALSGYGSEEDRKRSLEAGFDAHLIKPAGIQALPEAMADRK